MNQNSGPVYQFGPFLLNPAARLLSRGCEKVPLTPKAFDLLQTLVSRPGQLWEREILVSLLWPDTFVEENNLADNISRIRKALADGENGQKFIETVPKRGYRFICEVVTIQPAVEESAAPSLTVTTPNLLWPRIAAAVFGIAAALTIAQLGWTRWKAKDEAERLEVQGSVYLAQWSETDIRKSLDLFNRSIARYPTDAAYSGISAAWMFLSDLHLPPREAMPRCQAAAVKALQLNGSAVSPHIAFGIIRTQYDWDWAGGRRQFQQALQMDPDSGIAHQMYGWYLIGTGHPRDAQKEMARALDPESVEEFDLWNLGISYYFARQYDQAIEQYRRAIAIEPKSYWPHLLLGWAYEQAGQSAEAISELQAAGRYFDDNPQALASLAHAYAASGQEDRGRAIASGLMEEAKQRYVSPYDMATVYAGLGDPDQAIAWLERAYEDRSGWLAWFLKVDPKFDALRSDPRFRSLLARIGLAQ